ncbi:ABC transporter substrate-binding protein [Bacillus gobiensis]|uniref:ABC transporter substrate-binding protein n=1 Tax=Bacillus gobiensis TaxID=1441095 RepID=UPI003D1A0C27
MKGKKLWPLLLIFVLILAACNSNSSSNEEGGSEAAGEPQKGGELVGAMDTPPEGVFNPIFYSSSYENNILQFTHDGLITQNDKLEFLPSLAKDWDLSEDQTSVTFTLNEGVKWQDGEPFTANDVVFTYKTISDPDYVAAGGIRTDYVVRLKGYQDYSTGKTDKFEGVVADGDNKVTFYFEESNIQALSDASLQIIPEHIFKDIPVKDIPKAPETREAGKVIGTGPFKFAQEVQGEQYVLEKNPDYFDGEPYLDKVTWRVMEQSVILGELESGSVDFVADPNGFPPADYDTVKDMENISIIEQPQFGYQIMGMSINHRSKEDAQAGVIKPEQFVPNKKLQSKEVRQAIAYAVDRQKLIDGLLYGHGDVVNSPIPRNFSAYDEEKPNQYKFDPDKAKELLDGAGYKDTNGDGFREDPEGKEWVLNLNYPKGNQTREKSAPIIKQFLEDVGIKIDLRQPMESASYFESLEKNNFDWDLYLIGWSLSSTDPDPSGIYGASAAYNYGRWNNQEAEDLIKKANTPPDALDKDFRDGVFSDWQVKFQDEMPAFILYAPNDLWAHNNRLHGIEPLPYSMLNKTHKWWVSQN